MMSNPHKPYVPSDRRIEQVKQFTAAGPIHLSKLSANMRVHESLARKIALYIWDNHDKPDYINKIYVNKKGSNTITLSLIDSVQYHRQKRENDGNMRCASCNLPGQMGHPSSVYCDSCSVSKYLDKKSSVEHLSNDPRWKTIVARDLAKYGCCLICGSEKAKERDSRYCNWRHDVLMLDPGEVDALLNVYGYEPEQRDTWGRLVTR
jgi:hypothetical protein